MLYSSLYLLAAIAIFLSNIPLLIQIILCVGLIFHGHRLFRQHLLCHQSMILKPEYCTVLFATIIIVHYRHNNKIHAHLIWDDSTDSGTFHRLLLYAHIA